MLSRKKIVQIILLIIVSFMRICSASLTGSCIRYETFQVTEYKITPLDPHDGWFSHSFHFAPRIVTRVGLRSRRLFGCCEEGYQYIGFPRHRCQPVCRPSPCPANSHCGQPGICTCDEGYRKSRWGCVSNQLTRKEDIPTTTLESEIVELPCNGRCAANEECSRSVNVCVCRNGFQRSSGFAGAPCIRKCEPQCPENSYCSESGQCICNLGYHHNKSGSQCVPNKRTTEDYTQTTTVESEIIELPCNGSCATNEECSASDNICVCKDGFQRSAEGTNTACVPKCDPECQYADCTAPNSCTCWPHYQRTNSTSCHIECSEHSCVYGECNEKGTCVCANGFLSNGTSCVWAGDAILSEPDNCDCWSKFEWQNNKTDNSRQQCLSLCDGDDSIEVTSGCINFKHCQCFEGVLVCPTQIYKCSVLQEISSTISISQGLTKKATEEDKKSFPLVALIIVTISVIILIIVAILWIWQKRRGSFTEFFNYGRMTNPPDGEQNILY